MKDWDYLLHAMEKVDHSVQQTHQASMYWLRHRRCHLKLIDLSHLPSRPSI